MENLQESTIVPVGALSDEKRVAFYRKTYTHVALAVL